VINIERSIIELKKLCYEVRKDIITMLTDSGSGHPGASLSSVEILVSLYFNEILRHNPKDPNWEDRDRFILSKGHGVPALYSVMARRGYFPLSELKTLRKINSRLQGHPSRVDLPGIEVSGGALGQGLSVAVGSALGAKLDNRDYHTFCLTGDGEMQEGQIWEAAMSAAHYQLDNLCWIIDRNRIQQNGPTEQIMKLEPLKDKLKTFGWYVMNIDGHSLEDVTDSLKRSKGIKGMPTVIIANTIKGKGVSFMENTSKWHGKAPVKTEADIALRVWKIMEEEDAGSVR